MSQKHHLGIRFIIFCLGLLVMAFGLDLLIIADLGPTPWDVLHVGLFTQFGLTIGSWSIIVGFFVLGISALIMKKIPKIGAYLNMLLLGLFMDMFLKLLTGITLDSLLEKIILFTLGIIINAIGMGIYISAQLGAGPRDSFMLAVTSKTGWKVSHVRRGMEVIVLFIGWLCGGPVFIGTIIFVGTIGTLVGLTLPFFQRLSDGLINKLDKHKGNNEINRGASI
ncbi:YczE/YyaS/YitT family protein [Heyndrickxia sp. NPDC080065]|uniref:YczE/YyaS/YitT family protein n=1 Tax=Heyndrickxia sp. NPDC080065 TaxID=3390568 RepID=UPI003D035FD8